MLFWISAIAIAAIAALALFFSGGRQPVGVDGAVEDDVTTVHHKLQFREIEADIAAGRLGAAEAELARAELAREVLRQRGEAQARRFDLGKLPLVPLAAMAAVGLAFVVYAGIGAPSLDSRPLADRQQEIAAANIDVNAAVTAIEAHLAQNPDDLRGWQVVAPVYMQARRFEEAETAFRRILALAPPSADSETDLAEALILKGQGVVTEEAKALLDSAIARDPQHLRSRFYLAGQAMQAGDFNRARALWSEIIAMGRGDEAWMQAARNGLAMAEAGQMPGASPPLDPAAMVARLADRLSTEGGSLEEWTQLVRGYVVLDQADAAQRAYDAAIAAYPDTTARAALDLLAKESGLDLGHAAQ